MNYAKKILVARIAATTDREALRALNLVLSQINTVEARNAIERNRQALVRMKNEIRRGTCKECGVRFSPPVPVGMIVRCQKCDPNRQYRIFNGLSTWCR